MKHNVQYKQEFFNYNKHVYNSLTTLSINFFKEDNQDINEHHTNFG